MLYILGNLLFLTIMFLFFFWIFLSIRQGKYAYVNGRTHVNRAARRSDKEYMKYRRR